MIQTMGLNGGWSDGVGLGVVVGGGRLGVGRGVRPYEVITNTHATINVK